MSDLSLHLAQWKPFTAIVVGDFMLDSLVFGDADRLAGDAPVPVLHVRRTESQAGGSANVCTMLRALRGTVHAVGITGEDDAGRELRGLLASASVETGGLLVDPQRPTTVKRSLIGLAQHRHPQKMFRLDYEDRTPVGSALAAALLERFESLLPGAQVVCIEDYGKGVCTPELCRGVIERARRAGLPVLVDPASIADYSRYAGATTITPNRTEAERALGLNLTESGQNEPPDEDLLARRAGPMLEALDLECLVLTLDRHGAALLDRDSSGAVRARVAPTVVQEVYDVTGAGDMVLAALAGARASGVDWFDAVRLANVAAGLEIRVAGVAPIPLERLWAEVMRREGRARGKLRTLDELLVEVAALRAEQKQIVLANGCFDILHAGHLSLLRRAAEFGDHLVVAINADESVRRLKGPERPVNSALDRAALLGGLECVGSVVIFSEDTPTDLIRRVRPDVLVKGAEYRVEQVPGREYAGRVELLEMVEGKSTTGIVRKVRQG